MKFLCYFITVSGILLSAAFAQQQGIVMAQIRGEDTILLCQLQPVDIISQREFASQEERYRFNQLRYNITVIYPYVKAAGILLREINQELAGMDKRRDKRKYLRLKEKEIREKFADPIKNLNVTQGKLLVTLIERETGQSCYYLIKEYKGTASALFWQSVGAFNGYNLKVQFDAQEDRDIEFIMRTLERSENVAKH